MRDDEQNLFYDEYGEAYSLDQDGNRIPPLQAATELTTKSGFRYFDDSDGHCSFCGNLICNGECFK
jgi:hypothetical protein